MRFLLKATMPVEAGNAAIKDGSLGKKLEAIQAELQPEAVYFLSENGRRTGYYIINMQDVSEIPRIAEPFFLAFNASVEIIPVMTPEDLRKAGPDFEQAVRNYA